MSFKITEKVLEACPHFEDLHEIFDWPTTANFPFRCTANNQLNVQPVKNRAEWAIADMSTNRADAHQSGNKKTNASINTGETGHSASCCMRYQHLNANVNPSNKPQSTGEKNPTARERFEFEKLMRLKELRLIKYEIDERNRVRFEKILKDERVDMLRLQQEHKAQNAKK